MLGTVTNERYQKSDFGRDSIKNFSVLDILTSDELEGWGAELDDQSNTMIAGGVVEFPNKFSLSIRNSPFHYCDWGTVEIAVLSPEGGFYRLPGEADDVKGWVNRGELLIIVEQVRSW